MGETRLFFFEEPYRVAHECFSKLVNIFDGGAMSGEYFVPVCFQSDSHPNPDL